MPRPILILCLLALPLLAWWAYLPGLGGAFLFDDFNNLGQLGAYGKINNLRSLLLYLSSGNADPTGRPLALLTFLIDANDWPADAESFKRTNILLHLLNGLLLTWVLLKLGRKLGVTEIQAQASALLGATIWTVHPFLVSTTLYVVQREAMLPATFTLLAALLWVAGRERLLQRRRGGLPLLLASAGGCTLLAVLCKANGVLLPLLLLVMDWTILQPGNDIESSPSGVRLFRRTRLLLLSLPSGFIAIWLLSQVPALFASGNVGTRSWSTAQRLITEPRVLCYYLRQLWIPRASGVSVFNDGFHASQNLLHPWTTLPALIAVLALVAAGFLLRRRHPASSFAILFYCAGQLLESTLIPLELYFEHRNYVPALPMFWPLALWLTGTGALRILRLALSGMLPLLLLALCHARASIWGKPFEQALLLAQTGMDSPRAQANAASYEAAAGRPRQAAARLIRALDRMPDEAQLAINLVDVECVAGRVDAKAIDLADYALTHNHEQTELVQYWLYGAVDSAAQSRCIGLDYATVARLIDAVRRNPYYSRGAGHQHDMLDLDGRLALAQGKGGDALRAFDSSLAVYATPDSALTQAAQLGAAGFQSLGVQHLEYYRTLQPSDRGLRGMAAIHAWLLDRNGYWALELDRLERQLRLEASAAAPPTTRDSGTSNNAHPP